MEHGLYRFSAQAVLLGLSLALAGNVSAAPQFVGSKACMGCHKAEGREWQRTRHAKAFDLLAPGKKPAEKRIAKLDPEKDYRADEKCLKCHTTGYKEEGGYKDMASAPDLAGVGCEMCHGAGKKYRETHKGMALDFTRAEVRALGQVYATLGDKVCENCHGNKDGPMTESTDPKYRFDLKKGLSNTAAFHEIYPSEGVHK